MSRIKVGDIVTVKSALLGKGTRTFWYVNQNFTTGKVLAVYGDSDEFANVEVHPGDGGWALWSEDLRVESSEKTIEFKDVQIGDLIRATRVAGEDSYVKTLRVVKRSPQNSTLVSEGGLEAVMLWQHETEGNRINATIELLDRHVVEPKRVFSVGDVVSADDLAEVDVEVVVRYADVTGAISLGVVVPGSDEIVFPDARMSLGGITRQTRYEIVYVEEENADE